MTAYDVIGDLHGCADALEHLLRELGYREVAGVWRHPSRQVVFVGDLVDRGPRQVDTVTMVRRMVDAGTALITMGNHEFNAIAWATPDPSVPGEHLRCHEGRKGHRHRHQHAAFLDQVGDGSSLHREIIDWFRTLPLSLDLDGLRVVHACWHDESLAQVPVVDVDHPIDEAFMVAAHDRDRREYAAVETVLKGPEMPVPIAYLDKDGHRRSRARIRWWDHDATTVRRLAEIPPGSTTEDGDPYPALPDEPSADAEPFRYAGDVPVVFGHYWRTTASMVLEPLAVCVDHSAVKGGHLAAYRWDGEPTVDPTHLVMVSAR